ncbi:hypothetical protein SDC9_124021 [bioreactor metagenome]|uniref:Uncharacterized protein n=1 Tax=bioreactor metagenome TaxID=1076179 RepID=A0A645CJT1_9ZZZZ
MFSEDTVTSQFSEMANGQKIPDPLSLNLYTYCGSNPILYQDAIGHIFMLVTAAIGAVLGGIGGAIYSQIKYGKVRWQNVVAGAAIGGVIGLTGGAAAGIALAGSVTASTGAVIAGGNALIATVGTGGLASGGKFVSDNFKIFVNAFSTAAPALGTQFGKLGKLVKSPNISIDWENTTPHGLERMLERGVTQNMVDTWIKTAKVLQQSGDKFLYVARQGVVVLSKAGQVITAYGSNYFDQNMQEIVNILWKYVNFK